MTDTHGALPDTCVIELYVGDNLLAMPDQQVRAALALSTQALSTLQSRD